MTIIAALRCDYGMCSARWPADYRDVPKEGLRRAARRDGWTKDYEDDLCPEHSDNDNIESIRRMAKQGMRDGAIGIRLGLSRGQVWSLRRKHGIQGQRPGRP